ncbi:MAG TPA: GNAT family N-acetyltransferase [Chitinophagales bacterium]|nr:GNAT family N-acetyltransferase [Chitinophagales bacterium]
MNIHLFDTYYLQPAVYDSAFHNFVLERFAEIYENEYGLDLEKVLSEKEKGLQKELSKNLHSAFQINYYILHGEEKVGWLYGNQTDYETFYLGNAGVLKEHRGKSVGTKAIAAVLGVLKEKGFQKACSKHAATNNSAIIPLLRAGFIITGLEINDCDGVMVQLTFFFNQIRRDVVDFRVGKLKPTQKINEALSLTNKS